ncbi:MAG: class I SAM-dependent methyltransferase [Chloroflexi bacterium]|nr:class I SAM-dependent methyltransferase [Chloroflexota bacterium]
MNGTVKYLNGQFDRLLSKAFCAQGVVVPPRVLRHYANLQSYEFASTIRRFVGSSRRVLIIGDAGGRDTYFLQMAGKEVTVLDIAPQALPGLVQAVVSQPLPFPAGPFDAIVIAEVLEHLTEDLAALRHLRTILRDDGVLVLTVPFFHDRAPYHVRIHSPLTIQRLLGAAGFEVAQYRERGGGFGEFPGVLAIYRYPLHLLNWLSDRLLHRTFYEWLNARLASVDDYFGRRQHSLWHRWSPHYGAILQCRKSQTQDFVMLNRVKFEHLTPERADGAPS